VRVGYSVSLVTGDVTIPAGSADAALAAIRALDRRDDLKTGWSRQQLRDGTFRERPHWSFTDPDEVEAAHTLADALRAFRFEPVLSPDDDICGVALEGGTRSRGDEVHLWKALAPFVKEGGEMVWLGEGDRVTRWSFDGDTLTVSDGPDLVD
jgi:hypothetical protein